MDLSIAYCRRSFRKMTLRSLIPTQVKYVVTCCFFLAALVSCTRETVHLPFPPTFVTASGVTFFKFFFQTIPDKNIGTRSKFFASPHLQC